MSFDIKFTRQCFENVLNREACWYNKSYCMVVGIVQEIIHQLKFVDYLLVHTHKQYNNLHLYYRFFLFLEVLLCFSCFNIFQTTIECLYFIAFNLYLEYMQKEV